MIFHLLQHVVVEKPLVLKADVLLLRLFLLVEVQARSPSVLVSLDAAPETAFAWEAGLEAEPAYKKLPVEATLNALVPFNELLLLNTAYDAKLYEVARE